MTLRIKTAAPKHLPSELHQPVVSVVLIHALGAMSSYHLRRFQPS